MKIIKNEVKHFKEIIVTINKDELTNLIADYVIKANNFNADKCICTVNINEVKEGSPEYHIGYGAKVTLVEDLPK